jgi:hypothetical protein
MILEVSGAENAFSDEQSNAAHYAEYKIDRPVPVYSITEGL